MPRSKADQVTPGRWHRKTPQRITEAATVEPPFLGELAPIDTDAMADLPALVDETPIAPLEPLEGPLPIQGKAKKGARMPSPEKMRLETGLEFLRRIIDDPLYLQNVLKDAQEGKLDKQLQLFIWQRIYGRPTEAPKDEGGTMPEVKIVHEFSSAASKVP